MFRRTFLGGSTAILLAGCNELTGVTSDGYVDSRVQGMKTVEFSAETGEVLTVTVDAIEVAEPEDDSEVASDAISFRLDHAEEGPLVVRTISEPETFDVTIENDGTPRVIVTNGAADVTIEPTE